MAAMKKGFGIGMRFRMRFEGEESPERMYLSHFLFYYHFVLLPFFCFSLVLILVV